MEQKAIIILFVGLLIFSAHAFTALFKKTKIPDVLLLIIIGLFLGPVFGIVSPKDFGKVGPIFSAIALIVILFEGGLELHLELLKKTINSSLILTLSSFFITMIAVSLFMYFMMGYNPALSIFVGAVLAGPAPTIIIPLSKQLPISENTRVKLTLEAALGEALSIVAALAVIQFMLSPNIEVGKITGNIISSFVFAVIIGLLSGFGWSIILNKTREIKNAIFLTPSFVFIIYGFTELLGYSGPVAALIFGITIGNAEHIFFKKITSRLKLSPITHNETEKLFFSEIVFLLKTFFFVYLGISIVFTDLWILYLALLITISICISRFIASRISIFGKAAFIDAEFTYSMFAKGLATTVLASLPFQLGIPGGENIQNMVYLIILISILLAGLFVFLSGRGCLKFITKMFYNELETSSIQIAINSKDKSDV